jgi:hypothetical protein
MAPRLVLLARPLEKNHGSETISNVNKGADAPLPRLGNVLESQNVLFLRRLSWEPLPSLQRG